MSQPTRMTRNREADVTDRLGERLRSELRALLAVARAAERVERLHKRQWNGPGAIARRQMVAALERLARVSGARGGRR